MKALVTGGAGFIGSHLVEHLLVLGAREVVALDDLSAGAESNLAAVRGDARLRFVAGDARDAVLVEDLVAGCDVVVHLAAAVGVRHMVEAPREALDRNLGATRTVLAAAARARCRVLVASSSEVYGKGSDGRFAEDDETRFGTTPRWAYAAGKLADEFLARAYAAQDGLDALVFRPFNVVGPRQAMRYGMVLPRFVAQALRGEPITVHGDGSQRRSFCHVRGVARALAALAAPGVAHPGTLNIGADHEVSILELAQRVRERTSSRSSIVHVPHEAAYGPGFEDVVRRRPDLRRLEAVLGWLPEAHLDIAIDELAGIASAPPP